MRHQPIAANPCGLSSASEALALGHLVAFPTETVYGLGADALNQKAVARIFAAKQRPADHPLILHVADLVKAKKLCAHWPSAADVLAKQFWPGPMTLILKKSDVVPLAVTGGQQTVGIRIPAHPVALGLLNDFAKLGSGVIAAPSANRFGAVSPTRAKDVIASLGDRLGDHDLVLDGGDCQVGLESTIVDLSGETVRILRPGGIEKDKITHALLPLGLRVGSGSSGQETPLIENTPRVSGSLASHYAPSTPITLLNSGDIREKILLYQETHPAERIACLLMEGQSDLPQTVLQKILSTDASDYAHGLYAALNDLDREGLDRIFIQCPPRGGLWEAIHDRLGRAAHGENQNGT